jgi:hypothetical protein
MMLSVRSNASWLTIEPDSVHFTSEVGVSSSYNVFVSDGRDSSQFPHLPLTAANVWITGSSEFSLGSDSILSFFGYTYVTVLFKATSTTPSSAVLHVQGDSNEVVVYLTGTPPDHINLSYSGIQNFGSLSPGVSTCDSETLYNPNSFSVTVTSLTIASQNTECQLESIPSVPFTMTGYERINFEACLTGKMDTNYDTAYVNANIMADYTYPNGSDEATFNIYGYVRPPDSTCLSIAYPIDFGGCYDGSTSSQPIAIANTTSGDVIVDSIKIVNGDTTAFQIPTSQFPMTLHGGSSGSFNASFAPPNTGGQGEQFSAGIVIYSTGKSKGGFPCSEMAGTLVGEAQVLLVDTIVLNAPPGGANTINISTNRTMSRHAIYINNDTTVSIDPISLAITDSNQEAYFGTVGNELTYINDSIIPANANPYLFDPIIMTLDAPDTGTYNVDMILTYQVLRAGRKTEITSEPVYKYHILAHRVPAAASSVGQPSLPVAEFTINPNPAHGDVTITLPPDINSTIEIYDVLGNLILSKQVDGSFVWNGENSSGQSISDGAYIIRVRQSMGSGEVMTSSKQLLYTR